MILRPGILQTILFRSPKRVREFAYLFGVCCSRERDAKRNASTLGVLAQNRSVIHRANGVSIGIEAAGRDSVYRSAWLRCHPETLPVLLRSRAVLPYRAVRKHLGA